MRNVDLTGTLYLGYPILATSEDPISLDGLLLCIEHGIVVFDFLQPDVGPLFDHAVPERQEDLYNAVYQKLLSFKGLRAGRGQLAVSITVLTIAPPGSNEPNTTSFDNLLEQVANLAPIAPEKLRMVNAVIQRTVSMKPSRKRANLRRADSRGATIKRIEAEIANLDRWQNQAAIESPDAPQRIRGLAGSGKTIVLALKAAYWHAQHPEWRIAVTFHTRSLYQQFRELIRRFCFEQQQSEPDWSRLKVLHSWGSASFPGFYSEIAVANAFEPRNLSFAKEHHGYEGAFDGVCKELVASLGAKDDVAAMYDAVLIDEAQDLPQSFFELAYLVTAEPRRIVWAYDELQTLTPQSMATPSILFGADRQGRPRVPGLPAEGDGPRRDIILPICYRNTPWALSIAHALGFGIYRQGGLVQFFDDAELWTDIGYEVVSGQIAHGQQVVLRRGPRSYPDYFPQLLTPEDAFTTHVFASHEEQADWVADAIVRNLEQDELEHADILIILADPLKAKKDAVQVMRALDERRLSAHLAGVTSSVDELFTDESIAISGIYRAKGNEAPMVYVLNSEYGVSRFELIRRRNTLFTAITRSRAWVRLCGTGPQMAELQAEVDQVVANQYRLSFTVPTTEQLDLLRKIHRDMGRDERARVKRGEAGLAELVEMLERGDLSPEQVSPELRERAAKFLLNLDGP